MVNTETANFVHETELLLACARSRCDSQTTGRIRALCQEKVDWPYLIRLSFRHGVMPLLYRSLMHACPEAVPKAALEKLRSYFQINACHNHFSAEELSKLLYLLKTKDIVAIPFKGPVLAVRAYGDLVLRQFGDLDILVRKQDVRRAKDILLAQGYKPRVQLTDAQEANYLESNYECVFVRGDGRVIVGLHWAILPKSESFPLDLECLWDNLETVSFAASAVPNLPPVELLIILCVHASKHDWKRLKWICDIGEMIRADPGMHWGEIMRQAAALGCERRLTLGLLLANDLLGTTLPPEVSRKVHADRVVKTLAGQVRANLFCHGLGAVEKLGFHLAMKERLLDRVAYSLHLARGSNRSERWCVPLPAVLSLAYYVARPFRLIGKYGLRLANYVLDWLRITFRDRRAPSQKTTE